MSSNWGHLAGVTETAQSGVKQKRIISNHGFFHHVIDEEIEARDLLRIAQLLRADAGLGPEPLSKEALISLLIKWG